MTAFMIDSAISSPLSARSRRPMPSARFDGVRLGRWLCAGALACFAMAAHAFSFDTVAARARQLANSPYKAPKAHLPTELREK